MNWDKLKQNVGWLFKLQPPAIHLDPQGHELPSRDEEWILQAISPDGNAFELRDLQVNGLGVWIGKDIVHRFDSDRSRGTRHGFLMLTQQMFIQADRINFRPGRPGERVNPMTPIEVTNVPVTFDFLRKSGIQGRLEREGFEVNGVIAARLAELELKGWERIIENDPCGRPTQYYLPDSRAGMELIFIKRRKPGLPRPRVQRTKT
jgi:hypothetical protein